jgi:hypothetical protein
LEGAKTGGRVGEEGTEETAVPCVGVEIGRREREGGKCRNGPLRMGEREAA